MLKRFLALKLRGWLWPTQRDILVRCSGIKELDKGTAPCFKELPFNDALRLTFKKGNMFLDIHFCSFECLDKFIKHSYWRGLNA